MTIVDFVAKQQAVLQRRRDLEAECEAEWELHHALADAFYAFEERLRRAREQREKYERALADKRAQRGATS
jgi:hypothetical protein